MLPIEAIALNLPAAMAFQKLSELGVSGLCCCQVKSAFEFYRVQHFIGAPSRLSPRCPHGELIHGFGDRIDEHQRLSQRRHNLGFDRCLAGFCLGKQSDIHDLLQAFAGRDLQPLAGIAWCPNFNPLGYRGEGECLISTTHHRAIH